MSVFLARMHEETAPWGQPCNGECRPCHSWKGGHVTAFTLVKSTLWRLSSKALHAPRQLSGLLSKEDLACGILGKGSVTIIHTEATLW